jgi:hypothetical protein
MIRKMVYVACDICSGHPTELADDAREARRYAAVAGYRRLGNKDVCPVCYAKINDTRPL